jgi:hypothetical protein
VLFRNPYLVSEGSAEVQCLQHRIRVAGVPEIYLRKNNNVTVPVRQLHIQKNCVDSHDFCATMYTLYTLQYGLKRAKALHANLEVRNVKTKGSFKSSFQYMYSYQSKEMFVGREELGADVLF